MAALMRDRGVSGYEALHRWSVENKESFWSLVWDACAVRGDKWGPVLVDGSPVVSCMTLAADADGRTIETIEGISTPDALHPLQEEFLRQNAFQCGYCAPGMIMSSKALIDHNPHPSEQEIREAIAGNLCRCTAYVGIVKAIQNVTAEGVS